LLALVNPVGLWLFPLYEGRRTPLHSVLGPIERGFYRHSGIDPEAEQGWRRYAVHMLIFNANSARPFENPTALTNFMQMLSIFLIGVTVTY